MGKFGDSNSNKYCSVPQCKSRCTNEISLFRFPKEELQKKRWGDAIKIEKEITQNMQVCSRHFVKNDYILSDYPGAAKVRRLKKSAVPSQNLPWQFPNKRVSPTLAKARMERLMNRTQHKISDSPTNKPNTATAGKKPQPAKQSPKPIISSKNSETTNNTDNEVTSIVENISPDLKVETDEVVEENDDITTPKVEVPEESELNSSPKSDDAPEAKNNNMRISAPTRLRQRKGVLKCELCGRKCLTPQALQTHQHIAHKNARNNQINPKKDSPIIIKPKTSPKPVPVALISVKKPESLQSKPFSTKINKPVEKSLDASDLVERVLQEDSDMGTATDSSETSLRDDKVRLGKQDQTKTEFECPKCRRRFAVYFMALKHIQKHHSGGINGNKMSNLLLPKPTRIEICTICSTTLDCNIHVCAGPLKLALGFVCTGCKQEYKTLTLFDMHKSSMHSDGVESMFFSTLDEFETWKDKMEDQTKVQYSILDQNDTKKIHRCTHRTIIGKGMHSKQQLCPSSIIVQEFTKGFQVHYYPVHYGHDFEYYALGEAFKKYSIMSLMNMTANQLPDSDEEVHTETDLYLQFKKLTDVLVNEAARINVSGLKKLMRKALDMIAIVNSYVEDDDDDMTSSSMIKHDSENDDIQDQVRKALISLKRKPSEVIEETPVKRRKSVFQSTENTLKTPRSNAVKISGVPLVKDEEIENVRHIQSKSETSLNQSPSFLGTYQDFVGKTLVTPTEKAIDKKKRLSNKKKPNEVRKKEVVKTKIGQFKQSSPKKVVSPKKSPISPRTSIGSVKEIEYEVKEQENDCNILILKI